MVHIAELEIDNDNEGELFRHGITAEELFQLLDDEYRVFRNRRHRAAQVLLIGRTHGGRVLTVPIASTHIEGRWRPVTGWDATAAEKAKYVR